MKARTVWNQARLFNSRTPKSSKNKTRKEKEGKFLEHLHV